MKKKAIRFTFLDGLVIVLAFAIIFIVVKKIDLNEQLQMPEQKITLTVATENKHAFVRDSLSIGDPVYQKGALEPFGTIRKIEAVPAILTTNDDKGTMMLTEVPERFDTFLTIETSGFVSIYGGFVIDNSFFYANQYAPLRTNKTVIPVRVLEVR